MKGPLTLILSPCTSHVAVTWPMQIVNEYHITDGVNGINLVRRILKGGFVAEFDKDRVVAVLNQILEMELAGVVRYTHYSFLVFGFGRIPIVSWLRDQANESLIHAQQVGEWITHLGAYPSLEIGPLLDTHKFDIGDILRESLKAEGAALELYRKLLDLARDSSVPLEEFARQMISLEELHAGEVDKMLRKPGQLAAFASRQP